MAWDAFPSRMEKEMKKTALLALMAVAASSFAGSWTFTLDGGSLNSLENPAISLGSNGSIVYGADTINGQAAQVATLTQNGLASLDPYFTLANPIGGNGGGARTNRYTVLMDVKIPTGGFQSLLQTGSTHASTGALNAGVNDNDGDWFINGSNGLGISGNYTDTGNALRFSPDTWSRLVLTIDTTTATGNDVVYRSYIDGVLQNVVQTPSNWGVDGRFSLGSTFAFFADEDSELRPSWSVNNIAVFDRALTANEVAAYGGATAGAPVPEPATMAALGFGALALIRKRRSAK